MKIHFVFLIILALGAITCGRKDDIVEQTKHDESTKSEQITFVELGSVNCVPCRQMQPVMKSIEEKYKGKVEVVFHDVWKDKNQAQKYGIQLIPTQVFLDEKGNEFFRHEGFFSEEEIIKLLDSRGIKP